MTTGGITKKRALSYAGLALIFVTVLLSVQAVASGDRMYHGLAALALVVAVILFVGSWAAGLPKRETSDDESEWSSAIR